jgi:nucleotide-binding universal stress UspA family protein
MTTEEPASPIVAAFAAGSPRREAVDFALAASRITGAPPVFVTVRRGGPMVDVRGGAGVEDAPGEEGRAVEHMRLELQRRGIRRPDVRVLSARRVGAGLVEAMRDLQPSLLVLGSPAHKGKSGALLGDVVEDVIHETACPVALVPHGYHAQEGDLRVVGAAFTPTEEGRAALRTAAALARAASAELRVIEARPEGAEPGAELQEALAALDAGVEVEARVLPDDPVGALIAASDDVDLLVIGSRARGTRRALMLGSVSREVAERATCPVLVVPRAAAGAAEALVAHAEAHTTA